MSFHIVFIINTLYCIIIYLDYSDQLLNLHIISAFTILQYLNFLNLFVNNVKILSFSILIFSIYLTLYYYK